MPSVELRDLRIRRGGQVVINRLSFACATAGWLGIIGANGSGKTSLLRGISGRLDIESGQIVVNGTDYSARRAVRAELMGFAVDPAFLPGELTAREVFALTGRQQNAQGNPALAGLYSAMKLDGLIDRRCKVLSSGNAQRVAIFAAFLNQPSIVILDEPFNGLDPLTAFDLKIALSQYLKDQGILLITAIHDFTTMAAYCDQGIMMNAGDVSLVLSRSDLRAGLANPRQFEEDMASRLRTTV